MAAVQKIFGSSAHYYMTIGNGLDVYTADLKPIPDTADTNLIIVFQRWFDADRDVNWDTLINLCEDFPDKLGKAKSNLQAYMGKLRSLNSHHKLIILFYSYKNMNLFFLALWLKKKMIKIKKTCIICSPIHFSKVT